MTFAARARDAIGNHQLHVALDRTTATFGTRRFAAIASLDHFETVRDRARAAKMHVLRTLGDSLQRFEQQLIANGVQVHWAENGDAANRIIVEIATGAGVRRVAKSKSMVSEETHLNHALEAAGIAVIETDLGEYIVQLAKDRPSHIIAPIVHMTREQVGRVMTDTLAVPYSDDTQTLAGYARERLREEFLQADMGLSGVNFGVVENGTICLATNEGNGRMITTLPRVHVALMGIEKLVPTMADLDRLLKLLARSATGQKLTVYTTLLRGPRRQGDDCGPEELHVVLLDNGRTLMLAGETAEILGCIRCGACLNACPVYRSVGGHAYGDTYPGPVGAIVTPGLRGIDKFAELPGASSLCGACRDVCPVRLDIPRMLLTLRHEAVERTPQPFALRMGLRAFAQIATRPPLYRRAMSLMRLLLRSRARDGWIHKAPGLASGWTAFRELRAPAAQSFEAQWRARTATKSGS
ncbi:MAG TPA: LutB/LldF family L-lactate oxidation iron-sulfur protein [Vicinamibacterales bacterium]|nr:LutB/LldF family L-lactate oxidation iron-sulfur protein [Vicinamibacterales bacterium]